MENQQAPNVILERVPNFQFARKIRQGLDWSFYFKEAFRACDNQNALKKT